MVWWRRSRNRPQEPQVDALVAAAKAVEIGREKVTPRYDKWQTEVWGLYQTLGEFSYAVDWRATMISRCRLRAARVVIGQDEPEIVDDGDAAEFVSMLFGGPGGAAEAMRVISVHLGVPGESWVVAEERDGREEYRVCSSDELRPKGKAFEILDDQNLSDGDVWRPLSRGTLMCRVWDRDERKGAKATSTGRKALDIMRELELVNRKINAEYLSRLASAGLLIFPSEAVLPARPEFADEPDPFIAEFIETARTALANPGSAAAVVPIPMKLPAEYAERLPRLVDFTLASDEKLLDKRDSAIRRLATRVSVPAEILLGVGAVNHWTGWLIDEQAVKTHIVPHLETICHGLTVGYLWPRLKAAGIPRYWEFVVWYDTSEITARPDLSENAAVAYDRLELSGEALRRHLGFDEADAPSPQEREEQALQAILRQGGDVGLAALAQLLGREPPAPVAAEPQEQEPQEQDTEPEPNSPPEQDGPPGPEAVAAAARMQGRLAHRITIDPVTGQWSLLHHPQVCADRLFSCPVTHAAHHHRGPMPGQGGDYECWLSPFGKLIVGGQVFDRISGGYLESTHRPRRPAGALNGKAPAHAGR